jgi:hypothetical protein
MNRNDFLNMMSVTVPLSRQLIGEVYELIDIFPYFQSAHMLLLKGLMDSSDVKFQNQLRNSAIHIADREVLYYMLNRKPSAVAAQAEITPEKAPAADSDSDMQQTVIESARNSADLINEIENVSGDKKPDQNQDNLNHPPGHSILVASETDSEDAAGVMLLIDEESPAGEERVFFMDPGFSVPVNNDLLELDLDENRSDSTDNNSAVIAPSDSPDADSRKKLDSDLIDKFIIANPRIEPIREKSNFGAEEVFTPFVEEGGGFVTETLAKIYLSQGYYSKAIDIYEKLSLKFPEKSSYFASQIEKVKEYIKK